MATNRRAWIAPWAEGDELFTSIMQYNGGSSSSSSSSTSAWPAKASSSSVLVPPSLPGPTPASSPSLANSCSDDASFAGASSSLSTASTTTGSNNSNNNNGKDSNTNKQCKVKDGNSSRCDERTTLRFRRLQKEDEEAVRVVTADVYGGRDYVLAVLPQWLLHEGQKHWTLAAVDAKDELMGFEVLTPYDFGRTGWLEALRVHPGHRGKGVALSIQGKLISQAFNTLGFQRVRYTTHSSNSTSCHLAARCGLRTATSWGVLNPKNSSFVTFAKQVAAARELVGGQSQDQSKRPSKGRRKAEPVLADDGGFATAEELRKLALAKGWKYLLQSYWKAFDFELDNLEELFKTHEPVLVTRGSQQELLAFSWAYHRHDERTGLDFYATMYTDDDLDCTLRHIEAQVQLAIEANASAVTLMYPASLESKLHDLGLADRHKDPVDGTKHPKLCKLFERNRGDPPHYDEKD